MADEDQSNNPRRDDLQKDLEALANEQANTQAQKNSSQDGETVSDEEVFDIDEAAEGDADIQNIGKEASKENKQNVSQQTEPEPTQPHITSSDTTEDTKGRSVSTTSSELEDLFREGSHKEEGREEQAESSNDTDQVSPAETTTSEEKREGTHSEESKYQKDEQKSSQETTEEAYPTPEENTATEAENREASDTPSGTKPSSQQTTQKHTPPTDVETYYKDMSSFMEKGDAGDMAQVLHEAHRHQAEEKQTQKNKKSVGIMIVLTLILLLAGVALLYIALEPNSKTNTPEPKQVNTLARADTQTFIDGTNASHFKIETLAKNALNNHTKPNSVHHIYFGTRKGGGQIFTTQEFFNRLELEAPPVLTNQLHDQYMFGTYSTNKPHPFLLLRTSSYTKAFRGMEQWEDTMFTDLRKLFGIPKQLDTPEARQSNFYEKTIHNTYARVLSVPVIATSTQQVRVIPPDPATEATSSNALVVTATGSVATKTTTSVSNPATSSTVSAVAATSSTAATPSTTSIPGNTATSPTTTSEGEIQERIVRKTTGTEGVLLYTFLNESTILITTHPDVIPEMITRLANKQLFNE